VRGEIDSSKTALANLILADEVTNRDLDDWGLTTAVTCGGAMCRHVDVARQGSGWTEGPGARWLAMHLYESESTDLRRAGGKEAVFDGGAKRLSIRAFDDGIRGSTRGRREVYVDGNQAQEV